MLFEDGSECSTIGVEEEIEVVEAEEFRKERHETANNPTGWFFNNSQRRLFEDESQVSIIGVEEIDTEELVAEEIDVVDTSPR